MFFLYTKAISIMNPSKLPHKQPTPPNSPRRSPAEITPPEPAQQTPPKEKSEHIKNCLAGAICLSAYGCIATKTLTDYAYLQSGLRPALNTTIDELMQRAQAIEVSQTRDFAYAAIALQPDIDLYFRFLAAGKISTAAGRLDIGLKIFKSAPGIFTKESYDQILEDLGGEDAEMANNIYVGVDLNPDTQGIRLLSEESLREGLSILKGCFNKLYTKPLSPDLAKDFLDIALSPKVQEASIAMQILNLLKGVRANTKYLSESIQASLLQIYTLLIKESHFHPILRLEILKTMPEGEDKKSLAIYLLTDKTSPVVLELNSIKTSAEEHPLATVYLDCLPLIEDHNRIHALLGFMHSLPAFNHAVAFYMFLLNDSTPFTASLIAHIEQTSSANDGKRQALDTARTLKNLGISDLSKGSISIPKPPEND